MPLTKLELTRLPAASTERWLLPNVLAPGTPPHGRLLVKIIARRLCEKPPTMWPRSPLTPNRIDASSVGPHFGLDLPTVTWAPLKYLRRIRLFTPPPSSAHYAPECPSVRTSLRSPPASWMASRWGPQPA